MLLVTAAYFTYYANIFKIGNAIDFVTKIPSFFIMFQYCATIIVQLFKIDETSANILITLGEIDLKLKINADEEFHTKSRRQTNLLLSLLCGAFAILLIFQYVTKSDFTIGYIVLQSIYFQCDVEVVFFLKLSIMLRERLNVIEKYLSKFVRKRHHQKSFNLEELNNIVDIAEASVDFIERPSPKNTKLKELAEAYAKIGEVCQMINGLFNFLMITIFVSTFCFVIILFWTSIYNFQSYQSARYVAKVIVGTISELSLICITAYSCEAVLDTKKHVELLLNKIVMDYGVPKHMRMQAKAFLELIEVCPLRIRIYYMFSIDLQMIVKFVGLCATYLVVVIQSTHFIY